MTITETITAGGIATVAPAILLPNDVPGPRAFDEFGASRADRTAGKDIAA